MNSTKKPIHSIPKPDPTMNEFDKKYTLLNGRAAAENKLDPLQQLLGEHIKLEISTEEDDSSINYYVGFKLHF